MPTFHGIAVRKCEKPPGFPGRASGMAAGKPVQILRMLRVVGPEELLILYLMCHQNCPSNRQKPDKFSLRSPQGDNFNDLCRSSITPQGSLWETDRLPISVHAVIRMTSCTNFSIPSAASLIRPASIYAGVETTFNFSSTTISCTGQLM